MAKKNFNLVIRKTKVSYKAYAGLSIWQLQDLICQLQNSILHKKKLNFAYASFNLVASSLISILEVCKCWESDWWKLIWFELARTLFVEAIFLRVYFGGIRTYQVEIAKISPSSYLNQRNDTFYVSILSMYTYCLFS